MDEIKDPILEHKIGYGNTRNDVSRFFKDGLSMVNLSQEQVDFVGRKFTEIFEQIKSSRNGLVMARGSIFALGSKGYGNEEWREHTASSMRELLHKWKTNIGHLAADFKITYISKNANFLTIENDSEGYYTKMIAYYSYLSCICHHEANDIVICARKLDGELKKSGQDSEEDFLSKVEDFYRFFYEFFSKYTKQSNS